MNHNVLLIGGNGFLGSGLQRELSLRHIHFTSLDLPEYDLKNNECKSKISNFFQSHDKIVFLSSMLGAKMFNQYGEEASRYNYEIFNSFRQILIDASKRYKQKYDVTFYSTSEVFGSLLKKDDIIDDTTPYMLYDTPRGQYSKVKLLCQMLLEQLKSMPNSSIDHLNIIRPFNVYGTKQRRGVVYDMVKSALNDGIIRFAEDTTRTLTNVKIASQMSVDAIMSNASQAINAVDTRCSTTMKTLAHAIGHITGVDSFISLKPDAHIQYRHVSSVNEDVSFIESVIKDGIVELIGEIRNECN